MNDAQKLEAATSILTKLAGDWFHFEKWPDGDGWLQVDGDTDLTVAETEFLASVKKPEGGSGPGGAPDDFDDDGPL